MFPYTDQQAQRFMQVYRDLKCNVSLSLRRTASQKKKKKLTARRTKTQVYPTARADTRSCQPSPGTSRA